MQSIISSCCTSAGPCTDGITRYAALSHDDEAHMGLCMTDDAYHAQDTVSRPAINAHRQLLWLAGALCVHAALKAPAKGFVSSGDGVAEVHGHCSCSSVPYGDWQG